MEGRTQGVKAVARATSVVGVHPLVQAVGRFGRRRRLEGLWRDASRGLLSGATVGGVAAVGTLVSGHHCPLWLPAVLSGVGSLAGVARQLGRGGALVQTARWLDASLGLKDRLETALRFLEAPSQDAVRQLQIDDATRCLEHLQPEQLVPLRTPREWNRGLMMTAAGVLIALVSTARVVPLVPGVVDAELAEQAVGLREELRALEEFQQQESDSDLQRLLESMNQNLQEMAETGTTPREAFAQLSEMEASLQQMQKRLSDPGTVESMKAIGEALALAEEMSKVGNLLASGDLRQAEAELSKLGTPKLDRQTQRAVTEKLRQQEQAVQEAGTAKAVGEAAGKMAEGLESGDSQKFEEGTRGLASEARRMANQQKLTELLQQQAMNLAQAKSEVESQARQVAQGQGRGGKKAGKGTAGNPQGAGTAAKAASRELRLTGENSGVGETETKKSQGNEEEGEQVAEREYRQNVEKFEALSETALESEPIPAGQKQLIRRYFQLIRPETQTGGGEP